QEAGRVHPPGLGAAGQGERLLAQGFRLFHLRQGERQQDRDEGSDRLLPRLQHQGHGADPPLHLAVQDAREGEGARRRDLRSGIFRRFLVQGREGPDLARRRPGGLQAGGGAAEGSGGAARPAARRSVLQSALLQRQLGRPVRQQDFGEMSMRIVAGGRTTGQIAKLGIVVAAVLLVVALVAIVLLDAAFAQGSPFGGPRPGTAPVPVGGVVGWLFAKQAEFYRQFSALIRASKADGTAAWSLMGLSFLYGIFHAAGPGHGKAVISSYLVANEETWMRGVVLSFLSAIMQAMVAVTVVGIAAVLLHASASTMNSAVNWIETASYALIILVGARLLWVKGRAFVAAL